MLTSFTLQEASECPESIPEPEEPKRKKITLIPFADMHTGGTTALHPNKKKINGEWKNLTEIGGWYYSDRNNFYPDAQQIEIWHHFEKCLDWAAEQRKDSQLVLVVDGDAIEGEHNNSTQVVTRDVGEMMRAHEELMIYAKERLNWQAGDQMFYVFGTDNHTRNTENLIGEAMGAYQYPNGKYCSSFLELHLNGQKVWIYHHGVSAGDEPNKGDGLWRQLKKIYWKCMAEGIVPPDLILTAHTHTPVHSIYAKDWKMIQGVILPSFQYKTRYAFEKVPLSTNKVGLQVIHISEYDGILPIKEPMLMASPLADIVRIGD